jgi:hypothetical protein
MYKKILLSTAMVALMSTDILAGSVMNNFEKSMQIARTDKVDRHIDQTMALHEFISRYINTTGDLTPTKAEINAKYNLPDSSWEGYSDDIDFTIDDNMVVFSNVMSLAASAIPLDYFKKTKKFKKMVGYIDKSNLNVKIPLKGSVYAFMSMITKANANPKVHVGENAPVNTLLNHYRPVGDGTVEIRKYNATTTLWDSVGYIGSEQSLITSGKTKCLGTFDAEDDLLGIVALDQTCAIVFENNTRLTFHYVESADKWVNDKTSAKTSNGLFNGDATILEMATDFIDSDGGSKAQASAVDSEFTGAKEFTKRDNSLGGYWATSDNAFIVASTLEGLITQSWAENAIGYIPDTFGANILMLKKLNVPGVGIVFAYLASGYDDVLDRFSDVDSIGTEGLYVYDVLNNTYFEKKGLKHFASIDGLIEITSNDLGRDTFVSAPGVKYYTTINDCDEFNCNGTSGNYFGGTTKDNLYEFVNSEYGNRKNNLIDGVSLASLNEAYTQLPNVAVVGGIPYQKDAAKTPDTDIVVYKNLSTGNFVTGGGDIIGTNFVDANGVLQLPADFSLGTSGGFNSQDRIILLNYDKLLKFTNATDGAKVYLSSSAISIKNYEFVDNGTANGFWTDNVTGDGQQSANIIMSSGSRSDLPNVTHSLTAVTKDLGPEARYTTNGVAFSEDSTKYQWFYSSTGTTTNGMVDNPCDTSNGWNPDYDNSRCVKDDSYNATATLKCKAIFYGTSSNGFILNGRTYTSNYSGYGCNMSFNSSCSVRVSCDGHWTGWASIGSTTNKKTVPKSSSPGSTSIKIWAKKQFIQSIFMSIQWNLKWYSL